MTDQASAVDWGMARPGDAIYVHDRPKWLPDDQVVVCYGATSLALGRRRVDEAPWDRVVRIYLPAHHWYYAQRFDARQPEQFAESAKNAPPPIPPEVVERMVALVRAMAAVPVATAPWGGHQLDPFGCARAIVALLPKPVDPDLVEARELAAVASEKLSHPWAPKIRAGEKDDAPQAGVSLALAAIRRGRALAAAEREGDRG